jgi:hypothetical protein
MNEDPLKASRDEAFRMLGLNFVLFQQLEMALKLLTTISEVEGSNEDELEAFRDARRASLAKQSLGQVVGRFIESVFGESEAPELKESPTIFRAQFRIHGAEYQAIKSSRLIALTNERNQLAHHLVERFDLRSSEGIQDLKDLLEPQTERIRAEIREAISWIRAYQASVGELATHFAGEA